jgi:hypothetical protein
VSGLRVKVQVKGIANTLVPARSGLALELYLHFCKRLERDGARYGVYKPSIFEVFNFDYSILIIQCTL